MSRAPSRKAHRAKPAPRAVEPTPDDPMLQVLLSEMVALSRILPPSNMPGADADDDAIEAAFDNMPV